MSNIQIFMGAGIALLCAIGFLKQNWLLKNTGKGQRLTELLGEHRATWMIRGILLAGIVFGALLASDFIQPISW